MYQYYGQTTNFLKLVIAYGNSLTKDRNKPMWIYPKKDYPYWDQPQSGLFTLYAENYLRRYLPDDRNNKKIKRKQPVRSRRQR